MTFMTLAEAKEACALEFELWEDASETAADAFGALEGARDAYDSAGGLLDDSSFWDVVAAAVVVGACFAPEPFFSKFVCGVAAVGGTATVTASELDRHDEIVAAEQAMQQAEIAYDLATNQAAERGAAYFACLLHHLSKGGNG